MSLKQIVPNVYSISLGAVNAFLIDTNDDLTLIDTGIPGSEQKILQAVQALGKQPSEINQILVSHCHPDHAGGLAALKTKTDAPAYMHPLDAAMVSQGNGMRPLTPAPGLLRQIMFRLFIGRAPGAIEAAMIEYEVNDGDELPIASGLQAIHIPGHCAGQLAFLWPRQGEVLFAADAASNIMRLGLSVAYEDLDEGIRSLSKLAALKFEVACFGHGKAITEKASDKFKQKWA